MLHLLPESGLYRPDPKTNLYSLAIHAAAILLLAAFASSKRVIEVLQPAVHLTAPVLAPLTKASPTVGGGGDRSLTQASAGRLARASTRQFVPPEAVLHNLHPKLTIEPTLIMDSDASLPQVNLPNYGDPLGRMGPPSNGPGSGGGIGTGNNGGVGSGDGPSAGSGAFAAGIDGVSAPVVIFQVDPEYSEEARKAKMSGVVVLDVIVDPSGKARDIRVHRGAGLGLDERAIRAVQQWRFKPGTKSGKPVPVRATIEVNFRLL